MSGDDVTNGAKVLDVMESRGALAAYRVLVTALLSVGVVFLGDIRANQQAMSAALNGSITADKVVEQRVSAAEGTLSGLVPRVDTNGNRLSAVEARMAPYLHWLIRRDLSVRVPLGHPTFGPPPGGPFSLTAQ